MEHVQARMERRTRRFNGTAALGPSAILWKALVVEMVRPDQCVMRVLMRIVW